MVWFWNHRPVTPTTAADAFMAQALDLAREALADGDVPVGAIVVDGSGNVIGTGRNTRERDADPTGHAEMVALRQAAAACGEWRLEDCTIYVTLEPCTMCAAAISFARIRRLYFGALDEKGGAVVSGVRFFAAPTCHHVPEVYSGLGETRSAELLRGFFRERRG